MNLNLQGASQIECERVLAAIFRTIANEMMPRCIRLKEDTPGNHSNGMIPILDTQMALVDGLIVHHHYAKPMASKRYL